MACSTETKAVVIGQKEAPTPAKSGNPEKPCSAPASSPAPRFQRAAPAPCSLPWQLWGGKRMVADNPVSPHVWKWRTARVLLLEDSWTQYQISKQHIPERKASRVQHHPPASSLHHRGCWFVREELQSEKERQPQSPHTDSEPSWLKALPLGPRLGPDVLPSRHRGLLLSGSAVRGHRDMGGTGSSRGPGEAGDPYTLVRFSSA